MCWVKQSWKVALPWIIGLIGLALYVASFFIEDGAFWHNFCSNVGELLLVGVLVGYISTAAQFLGVFKKELQDIIYAKQFIGNRKDIEDVWENISKELFKNKFKPIHKDFLKVIETYFPTAEVSFYENYEVCITIDWINRETGLIKVKEDVRFNLIADTDKEICYPLKNWTIVNDKDNYQNTVKIYVNDKEHDCVGQTTETIEDGMLCLEQDLLLSGSTKYKIRYVREKKYNLYADFYLGFKAKYIVKNVHVTLERYPDDINVLFVPRGTQYDFEKFDNDETRKIERKYTGIVLPKQGYVFALHKKYN